MKFLVIVLQLLAVIGGVGAGVAWRLLESGAQTGASDSGAPAEPAKVKSAKDDQAAPGDGKAAHAKQAGEKAGHGEGEHGKGSHDKAGHGKGADAKSGSGFVRFGRQFIVPVYRESGPGALVVVEINLEVPGPRTEIVYAQEPRLRDALFSELMELSNDGAFDGRIIDPANMERIRARLLAGARRVVGDDAQGVLILGITRQNV